MDIRCRWGSGGVDGGGGGRRCIQSQHDADLGTQREGEIAYVFDECILCTDCLSAMIAILEDWRFLVRSERARDRLVISRERLDSHVA